MWVCNKSRFILKEEHIIPSLRLTFSAYENVKIEILSETNFNKKYLVTFRDKMKNYMESGFEFRYHTLENSPTHL